MNDKKICFIMCVNNWQYANEAMYYINRLDIPEGYSIDVLTVEEATGMAAGYNEAMSASDAKYKVYLHQDAFIIEPKFIHYLLDIFSDKSVGMFGMVGSKSMPEDMVMWHGERIGRICAGYGYGALNSYYGSVNSKYETVWAIDGLLMATQYDITWKEDIVSKWDFYDVSQSMELKQAGYKVVVPNMGNAWVLHDEGYPNMNNYYEERDKVYEYYFREAADFPQNMKDIEEIADWKQRYGESEKEAINTVNKLLDAGSLESKKEICKMFENKEFLDTYKFRKELSYVINAINIFYSEEEHNVKYDVFDSCKNLEELVEIINQVRFLTWEIEYADYEEAGDLLCQFITEKKLSPQMIKYIVDLASFNRYETGVKLAQVFKQNNMPVYELYSLLMAHDDRPNGKKGIAMLADFFDTVGQADKALAYRNKLIKSTPVDEKKICFIMCVNDYFYANEAMYYINRLHVPHGYTVDVLTVEEAKSMTSGYNEGMLSSDAKYKVYMHQDVMIINPMFIYELLKCFEDDTIGMFGLMGSANLAPDKVMWHRDFSGCLYRANIYGNVTHNAGNFYGEFKEVESIDGLLMATQYDIPWREDVLDKWDFYDISQSYEFRQAGYKVVLPYMNKPWAIHDESFSNMVNYYEQRDKFIEEICHERVVESKETIEERNKIQKWFEAYGNREKELVSKINDLLSHGMYKEICELVCKQDMFETYKENSAISYVVTACKIYKLEEKKGAPNKIFNVCSSVDDMLQMMNQIRFLLWETQFADKAEAEKLLCQYKEEMGFSQYVVEHLKEATLFKKDMCKETPGGVSFVVIANGNYAELKVCLDSIRLNCELKDFEVIVIDNVEEPNQLFACREDIKYFINDRELELSYDMGVGFAKEDNDIMLLASNAVLTRNAMSNLLDGLYSNPDIGMAGAMLNYGIKSQIIDKYFDNATGYLSYAKEINALKEGKLEYVTWLDFTAVLIKQCVYNKVGGFGSEYVSGAFLNCDFCVKTLLADYKNVLCHNSFIYVCNNNELAMYNPNYTYQEILIDSTRKFKSKWGMAPHYYTGVRDDLIDYIKADKQADINVLEVGCGTGSTLGRIKYLYPNSTVHGIEIVDIVAELGAKTYDIVCDNIETRELDYEENYLDYVIFGDVLEHLTYPEDVLKKLIPYMKQGGCILASIPNMMNAEVIYNLLRGDFTYEDSGIRDRTHLRFFTYKEIIKMFDRCGYDIVDMSRTITQGTKTDDYPEFFEKLLAIEGVADKQFFDSFQYLVCAKKR